MPLLSLNAKKGTTIIFYIVLLYLSCIYTVKLLLINEVFNTLPRK